MEAFDEPGPYATVEDGDAFGGCTVHRPEELGSAGLPHPIVLWGNGTAAIPAFYRDLLAHLASHGFVVAAADTPNAGAAVEMLDCRDQLLLRAAEENDVWFEQLDARGVGATGHSQGGAGALMAGADPGVHTTAPLQPYIDPIPFGGRFDREAIGSQTGPQLLLSGDADDIATPEAQQRPVFEGANVRTVWATLRGADHFEPLGDAGRYRGVVTAWFRDQLMDDPIAAERFADACGLCDEADWTVEERSPASR
ncbi:MAG: alpha/beta hydrolase [Myxococcota bacterium]